MTLQYRGGIARQMEEQFTIIDLDSFNGTFVNGVPVKEQILAHGDQIAVGNILRLFLLHETETEEPPSPPCQEHGFKSPAR